MLVFEPHNPERNPVSPRKPTSTPSSAAPRRRTSTIVDKSVDPLPAAKVKKATAKNSGPRAGSRATARREIPPPQVEATTPTWAQEGDLITTSTGLAIDNGDNSLKVGQRGPTLLGDFYLREIITHFDHERIPERVVHARGAGAHGVFEAYEPASDLTAAHFLGEAGRKTATFVRFSTVAGSRGSADTARDVRGFATKFYTEEGIFDLVGNNIPVFFIQDGVKFPDVIHAAKPEPDREIPQAQTAHDTFWDFASLAPETTHMLMWVMSDRAIPRSFRTMEGFGIHTFRLVNAEGLTSLVKFHWKPLAGTHSLVWEEAQKLGGIDPDFHRRDLWDSIESGNYPEWEFGVQVFPDTEDQFYEGIDLLDPTKIVPEEMVPVRPLGRMTLTANPANYFAETEQVAFHPGHLVRGIEVTDDPLIQARIFSYLDTQLTRLGGPNFNQLPINRTIAPVNNNERDGYGQAAIFEGRAPYSPNSVGGGCPFASVTQGYAQVPRQLTGEVTRRRADSFSDYYSQATLYWNSLSAVEQEHVALAFSFELGNVAAPEIQDRQLANLANVSGELTEKVAAHLGRPVPEGSPSADAGASPALSLLARQPGPILGRVVGVLAVEGLDIGGLDRVRKALDREGAVVHVIGRNGAPLGPDLVPDRTLLTADSVHYDALVVAGGSGAGEIAGLPKAVVMLQEAFRHHKTIAAWGEGVTVLDHLGMVDGVDGVLRSAKANGLGRELVEIMGWHRHWNRPSLG
jgi:catalase